MKSAKTKPNSHKPMTKYFVWPSSQVVSRFMDGMGKILNKSGTGWFEHVESTPSVSALCSAS